MNKLEIDKKIFESFSVTIITELSLKRYYITASSKIQKQSNVVFEDIINFLNAESANIVYQFIFANLANENNTLKKLNEIQKVNWPISWMQGDCCNDNCFTGSQFFAISGTELTPIISNNKIVGYFYETEVAEFCYLANIYSDNIELSNSEQVDNTFNKINDILHSLNMNFSNIARMWNYLDDLLSWYDDFNVTRTAFFNKHNIFKNKLTPAATGIGAANSAGAAYLGNVIAIKPKNNQISVDEIISPMQCPALDYKSSFSRAVKIEQFESKQIYVSGTASIEPMGKTVHIDDIKGQIELTMEVISEILSSQNITWENVSDSIAYFTKLEDVKILNQFLKENRYPDFPITISHANICRDNLLFELELNAIK